MRSRYTVEISTIVYITMDPARDIVRTTTDLGRALRARRRALGMTQGDLAMQVGLSVATVSAIENGKETARVGLVLDLCRDLGLTLIVES